MSINEIKIEVSGYSGVGKSTVIGIIQEALHDVGLSTTIFSVDDDHETYWGNLVLRSGNMIEKGTTIKIHEVQTIRKGP